MIDGSRLSTNIRLPDADMAGSVEAAPNALQAAATQISATNPLAPVGSGNATFPENIALTLLEKPIFAKATNANAFALQKVGMGSAVINLGDGYHLAVDDRSKQLVIANTETQAKTTIWGDGRVATADQQEMQFWGTTTFALGNDAKVTLQTVEQPDQPGTFILDKVTVTKDNKALILTGIADDQADNIKLASGNGYNIDDRVRDGFTVEEGPDGLRWLDEEGNDLTQALLDATRVGGAFGPGSTMLSLGEVSAMLSRFFAFLSTSWLSSFSSWSSSRLQDSTYSDNSKKVDEDRSADRRRIERQIVEQMMMREDTNDQLLLRGAE